MGGKVTAKIWAEKSNYRKGGVAEPKKLGFALAQKKTIRHEILPNGLEQKKRNDINNSEGAQIMKMFCAPPWEWVVCGVKCFPLFWIIWNFLRPPPTEFMKPGTFVNSDWYGCIATSTEQNTPIHYSGLNTTLCQWRLSVQFSLFKLEQNFCALHIQVLIPLQAIRWCTACDSWYPFRSLG